MATYFALTSKALESIKIEDSAYFMSVYPWARDSKETMGELIKSVDESPFDTTLVLDGGLGKPLFTLTKNEEAIKKCKKKKRDGPTNSEIFACEQSCRAQNPNCAVLIVVVTASGCSCICDNTDISQSQGADFWERNARS